ncbi:MAG: hypothetical protein ACE5IL_02265 [Myxococcota bacterium]
MRISNLVLPLLCMIVALPARVAATPAEIAQETVRPIARDQGALQFWWLPPEYWTGGARELDWSDDAVEEFASRMRNYLVLGVIDAHVEAAKIHFGEHVEIADRITLLRNGTELPALRRIDPLLVQKIPDLAYFLRVAAGPFAPGIRFFFFSNVDDDGKTVLTGADRGTLRLRYRESPSAEPLEVWWHGPLTAVAGKQRCSDGAPAEASWRFCPWTGEKLR